MVVLVVGVGEESRILMASIWSETSSSSRPEGRDGGVLEVSPGAILTVRGSSECWRREGVSIYQ